MNKTMLGLGGVLLLIGGLALFVYVVPWIAGTGSAEAMTTSPSASGPSALAVVLATFGLTLTGDTPYLHNTGGVSRAGEVAKGAYELPYSGGRAIEGGTPFAWQLGADGKPAQPFAAYVAVPGGGRVIAMGEGMATIFLGTPDGKRLTGQPRDARNTVYWGKDSEPFMADVFNWLLRRN